MNMFLLAILDNGLILKTEKNSTHRCQPMTDMLDVLDHSLWFIMMKTNLSKTKLQQIPSIVAVYAWIYCGARAFMLLIAFDSYAFKWLWFLAIV